MRSYLKTLPLLLLVMGCSPGPKADGRLSPLVREAVTFLPLIREDADLRDEKTEDIALAMTRLGAPRAGWDLTSQMVTPLRIATLYRLSVLSAKQGDPGSSQRAFATAEKGMEMYPLNPPRVPEIERAAAYAVLKTPAQARQMAESLGNPYDRNEAQAKVRAEEILRSADPISLPGANVILPEITTAWCVQALKAGPEAGRPLLDKALLNSRDGFPAFVPGC